MQIQDVKQRIDRIEECADQAKDALQAGQVPPSLGQSVGQLHQQARQAKHSLQSQQQADEGQVRQMVAQIEEAGDRAMEACRQAGNVHPQLQQAIQQAHQEASALKKQMQMG